MLQLGQVHAWGQHRRVLTSEESEVTDLHWSQGRTRLKTEQPEVPVEIKDLLDFPEEESAAWEQLEGMLWSMEGQEIGAAVHAWFMDVVPLHGDEGFGRAGVGRGQEGHGRPWPRALRGPGLEGQSRWDGA